MKADLDKITRSDLRNPDTLKELYVEAVRRKFWPNNESASLDFFSLAEKALQDDTQNTPGRLFYALIKAKDTSKVTEGQERRAIAKLPTEHRRELVEAAKSQTRPEPDPDEVQSAIVGRKDIGYYPAVMVQCFLPQHPLPKGQTTYQSDHGKASLLVRSGLLANPEKPNVFKECVVPFGPKPRLILPHINGQAKKSGSSIVDLGDSLRKFLASIGSPVGGRNGRAVTEQVMNIAAATFILGEWNDYGAVTKPRQVADEISFWIEKDEQQRTLWEPEMVLSPAYFKAIMEGRAVPVDISHLVKLQGSARRMDWYSWFSYRLPLIDEGKTVRVPLPYLHDIFGRDIDEYRLFKHRSKTDFKAIGGVYRHFNVDLRGDLLLMRHSPPPVPPNNITYLPPKTANLL